MAGVWRVVAQRQYEDLNGATGTFSAVVEVTFELVQSGVVGSIKVPLRDYTEDAVRAAIDAQARSMASIQGLEG